MKYRIVYCLIYFIFSPRLTNSLLFNDTFFNVFLDINLKSCCDSPRDCMCYQIVVEMLTSKPF